MVVDTDEFTSKGKVKRKNVKYLDQGALSTNIFLSLLHPPTRKMNGREPLVNYSPKHVVILYWYLNIMWQNVIEKEVVETIKQNQRRGRQEKQATKVVRSLTWVDRLTKKKIKRQQQTNIILT